MLNQQLELDGSDRVREAPTIVARSFPWRLEDLIKSQNLFKLWELAVGQWRRLSEKRASQTSTRDTTWKWHMFGSTRCFNDLNASSQQPARHPTIHIKLQMQWSRSSLCTCAKCYHLNTTLICSHYCQDQVDDSASAEIVASSTVSMNSPTSEANRSASSNIRIASAFRRSCSSCCCLFSSSSSVFLQNWFWMLKQLGHR